MCARGGEGIRRRPGRGALPARALACGWYLYAQAVASDPPAGP